MWSKCRAEFHRNKRVGGRYDEGVSDSTFSDPRLALNRIYTKRGDSGETSLAGGQRVPKDAPRIEAYGTVDELGAFVGLAGVSCEEGIATAPRLRELSQILRRVQHELFNLGSILATLPEDVHPKQARITPADSEQLEHEIDAMNKEPSSLCEVLFFPAALGSMPSYMPSSRDLPTRRNDCSLARPARKISRWKRFAISIA